VTVLDGDHAYHVVTGANGAVYFDYGSRPTVSGCLFRNNSTDGHGGAVFSVSRASQLENTTMRFVRCRFEGNRAKGYGGAANFHDSSIALVEKCVFTGNQAGLKGNAVAVTGSSRFEPLDHQLAGNDIFEEPLIRPEGMPAGRPLGLKK